jgi:hypothetical protein
MGELRGSGRILNYHAITTVESSSMLSKSCRRSERKPHLIQRSCRKTGRRSSKVLSCRVYPPPHATRDLRSAGQSQVPELTPIIVCPHTSFTNVSHTHAAR